MENGEESVDYLARIALCIVSTAKLNRASTLNVGFAYLPHRASKNPVRRARAGRRLLGAEGVSTRPTNASASQHFPLLRRYRGEQTSFAFQKPAPLLGFAALCELSLTTHHRPPQ